jgi:hypothetical protein
MRCCGPTAILKAAAKRAFQAMMTMRKIGIARIEAGQRGVAVDA